MTTDAQAPTPPRRAAWRAIILALVAVALVSVLIAVVSSGDSGDPVSGDEEGTPIEQGLSAECVELHTGHNAMRWDPTMADEMVDRGCAFPYEPFLVPLEGGEADPALDAAPFEPHLYEELWTLIADVGLGVCTVAVLPEEPADGFSFGFRYSAAPPGCPELVPSVDLDVREYVTRELRDAAAHASPDSLVLGRWTIHLEPADGTDARELRTALLAAGAVDVASA